MLSLKVTVSIHAPAGGATPYPYPYLGELLFQSTRPRGARLKRCPKDVRFKGFNPRARGGRDDITGKAITQLTVSIHAPAGGATTQVAGGQSFLMFQSTRPRGARRRIFKLKATHNGFQSTRPRGARLYNCKIRHFGVLESPKREPLRMPNNILRKPDIKNYNHNNIKRI